MQALPVDASIRERVAGVTGRLRAIGCRNSWFTGKDSVKEKNIFVRFSNIVSFNIRTFDPLNCNRAELSHNTKYWKVSSLNY